ncbi:putative F420-dependent oxidoreductase [Mycolicibacterium sp. BK556]|uniref:LLM class flavin-dependent oxidoreductase n=1 Tax=unclassified Mycolicibacterium TaxID=2636767 RepID=UPI0016084484|nr:MULTISPECIES: LLM class flavin-dependent oxidoreductase [unclassified Mycolicibacterium]MBB3605986.1 putative F420-dependent oxidoreductase [Mycolicibacterium sp. BK556]MBB3632563.1 putative F420-dependent oxidoreductase [Mycolicibacterium sp. BK607]
MTTYGINGFGIGAGPARFASIAEVARAADDAGCSAVWTSELYSRSATVPMAVIAGATTRASVGSNIAYGVGRTPLVWAAEARDLDELSGGRLILGLGNGTPAMMERWHGVSGEAPAARMRELVTVLRKLWRLDQGPVSHEGRFYRVDVAPTADMAPPLRERLPIYLAGVNPMMVQVVGAVADGLIGHPMFTSDYLEAVARPALARGASTTGRSVDDIAVTGIKMCVIDDDEQTARRRVAFAIGQYAASRVYDRLFELHGWSAAQQRIRQAARDRDTEALIAAVPDDAIDAIAVACTPGQFGDRLRAASRGFDHLALTPAPWGLSDEETRATTMRIIAELRTLLRANDSALEPAQ